MTAESTTTTCYVHTKTPAAAQCSGCGRDICIDCEEFEGGGVRCGPCAHKARGRRMLRNLAIAAAALVAMVALVLLVSSGGDDDNKKKKKKKPTIGERLKAEETPKRKFDYGRHAPKIAAMEREIEKKPCSKRLAVRFGEKLNTAGDYEGALLMAKSWFARCGDFKRLLWVTSYAHEKLGQFAEAAKIDTTLIEFDPRDNDYWWWRGKNYLKLDRDQEAAADFRQSIANQNLADSSGIAVLKLADVSKELDRPCVGAFALQYYSDAQQGDMNQRAKDLHAELHLAGSCDKLAGKGSARIQLARKGPVTKAKVRVNGKPATFLVDLRSGYTLVSKAFAAKQSIESDGPELSVFTAGKLRTGKLATLGKLQLARASATDVIALVAELPDGIDGVLGVSFFWRFEVLEGTDSIKISARK